MKHLFTNDTETYIAERKEDVPDLCAALNGEDYDVEEYGEWVQVDDSKKVTVGFEDEDDARMELRNAENAGARLQDATVVRRIRADLWYSRKEGRVCIEAPASWWALLPSGFLCSTEW